METEGGNGKLFAVQVSMYTHNMFKAKRITTSYSIFLPLIYIIYSLSFVFKQTGQLQKTKFTFQLYVWHFQLQLERFKIFLHYTPPYTCDDNKMLFFCGLIFFNVCMTDININYIYMWWKLNWQNFGTCQGVTVRKGGGYIMFQL